MQPYYLVMEMVKGGSLDHYLIKNTARLTVPARVRILLEGARGLCYLHDKGCIHR